MNLDPHETERAELAQAMADYLARGGRIETIPRGVMVTAEHTGRQRVTATLTAQTLSRQGRDQPAGQPRKRVRRSKAKHPKRADGLRGPKMTALMDAIRAHGPLLLSEAVRLTGEKSHPTNTRLWHLGQMGLVRKVGPRGWTRWEAV